MKFINTLPEWKNEGAQPQEELLESGFQAGYKPPAAIFNWFWSLAAKCITELQSNLKAHTENLETHRAIFFGDTEPEEVNYLWFAPADTKEESDAAVVLETVAYTGRAESLHVETDGETSTVSNSEITESGNISEVVIT